MKNKKIFAGIMAALLLCALPLSGVMAADRNKLTTSAQEPLDPSFSQISGPLVLETGLLKENNMQQQDAFTYGDTLHLTAVYTPEPGEPEPEKDWTVQFTLPGADKKPVLLGEAKLTEKKQPKRKNKSKANKKSAKAEPIAYQAELEYDTRLKQLPVNKTPDGKTVITATLSTNEKSSGKAAVFNNSKQAESEQKTITAQTKVHLDAKALHAEPQAVVYNGTKRFEKVPLTLTGVEKHPAAKFQKNKKAEADTVTAAADLTVLDKNAGTPQQDNLEKLENIQLTGKDAEWYRLDAQAVEKRLTIQKAPLRVAGVQVQNKTYDGTAAAAVQQIVFEGLVNGESLDTAGEDPVNYTCTALFADAAAGENKAVTVQEIALADTPAARNYQLNNGNEPQNATAAIAQKPITAAGFTVESREYDGTVYAALKEVRFEGLAAEEQLSQEDYTASAVFQNAAAGTEKTVLLEKLQLNNTPKANNYKLTYETPIEGKAEIRRRPLTDEMVGRVDQTQPFVYDGTAQKPTVTVSDKTEAGERITPADYTITWGENIQPGQGIIMVNAAENGNYSGSVKRTFEICRMQTRVRPWLDRRFKENKSAELYFTGLFTRPSESMPMPTGKVTVFIKNSQSVSGNLGKDGKMEMVFADLPELTECTYWVEYAGDQYYEPMKTIELTAKLTQKPADKPQKPAPEPEPAPTPLPFDWYPARAQIIAAQQGKVTVDAQSEIAVPHYIWQAFYGRDVTVTIQRGLDKFVFNGLDLKARGFDPDNGHNLTDLTAYIGKTYPKPTPEPKPEEKDPNPAESAKPDSKPETDKQPESKPERPESKPQQPETERPAEPAETQNTSGTPAWLYWVIGICSALAVILIAVFIVMRRKDS